MSTSQQLPPSERDLEVYESVRVAGASLRAAAAQFTISVTRVRQIVNRVVHWLAESLPPETDLTRQQQIQLARHLAADRLNYAYGELMELWRETQDTSFLLKTARLSHALARLGVVPGAIAGLLADAWDAADTQALSTSEGPTQARSASEGSRSVTPTTQARSASEGSRSVTAPPSPPIWDCAPNEPQPLEQALPAAASNTASPFFDNGLRTAANDHSTPQFNLQPPLRAIIPTTLPDPVQVTQTSPRHPGLEITSHAGSVGPAEPSLAPIESHSN